MSEIRRGDMVRSEAEATCEAIRGAFDRIKGIAIDIRGQVLELHDRNGWAVLGYATWKACVESEFMISYRAVNLELQAAKIEREIEQADADGKGTRFPSHKESPIEKERIPTKHLVALARVEPAERREVLSEAKASSPKGMATTKSIKETVDRRAGKPKPEPAPPVPRSQYKTEVNGQFAPDPPAIAKLRAAGKIGAGVVVEITEPEPDEEPETEPAPEAAPGEPEEEWLAKLPLSSMLAGMSLAIFQSDAKRFYRMRKARDSFRSLHSSAGKGLRKDGCYFDRISKFLTIADPRDWIRCTTPDNGGCSGTGLLTTHGGGACPKCFGRGYTIDNRRDWRKLA